MIIARCIYAKKKCYVTPTDVWEIKHPAFTICASQAYIMLPVVNVLHWVGWVLILLSPPSPPPYCVLELKTYLCIPRVDLLQQEYRQMLSLINNSISVGINREGHIYLPPDEINGT